ncbi:MAG: hypothetical protein AAF288_12890 [Planctomycetota bacterium]
MQAQWAFGQILDTPLWLHPSFAVGVLEVGFAAFLLCSRQAWPLLASGAVLAVALGLHASRLTPLDPEAVSPLTQDCGCLGTVPATPGLMVGITAGLLALVALSLAVHWKSLARAGAFAIFSLVPAAGVAAGDNALDQQLSTRTFALTRAPSLVAELGPYQRLAESIRAETPAPSPDALLMITAFGPDCPACTGYMTTAQEVLSRGPEYALWAFTPNRQLTPEERQKFEASFPSLRFTDPAPSAAAPVGFTTFWRGEGRLATFGPFMEKARTFQLKGQRYDYEE